jgi:hypothetical protein
VRPKFKRWKLRAYREVCRFVACANNRAAACCTNPLVPILRCHCRAYGIAEPTFTEGSGAVTVTFKAEIVTAVSNLVPGRHQVGTKSARSPNQVEVLELAVDPRAPAELMIPSGRTDRTKFRDQVVAPLLQAGLLEMTIPDRPRSSKQRYRITEAGRRTLQDGV